MVSRVRNGSWLCDVREKIVLESGYRERSRDCHESGTGTRQTGDPRDVPAANGSAYSRQAGALLRAPR